jgi:HNH endonuclease
MTPNDSKWRGDEGDRVSFFTRVYGIVHLRRTEKRELVRLCDPMGNTGFGGQAVRSEHTLFKMFVDNSVKGALQARRFITIYWGDLMVDVAEAMGLTASTDVLTDLLVGEDTRRMFMRFQTMAGDSLALVGEEAEIEAARVETYSDMGTNLFSHKERGQYSAEDMVRYFASRANDRNISRFLINLKREHHCVYTDNGEFKIQYENDDERDLLQSEIYISDFLRGEKDEVCNRVWKQVIDSFQDRDGRFSQLLHLLKAINHLASARDNVFAKNPQCQSVLTEAKKTLLKDPARVVHALNSGDIADLQGLVAVLQERLHDIQDAQCRNRLRKLESWLSDTRVNKHGIQYGAINRYRHELSWYTNDNPEAALQIRSDVFERDGGVCQYCGCNLSGSDDSPHVEREDDSNPESFHLDHVIPLSRGGNNSYDNLQILCSKCNLWKRDRLESEMTDEITARLYKYRSK